MSADDTVPVADVLRWLSRVSPADAWQLLVGCLLDDDTGPDATAIVAVEAERRIVVVEGGRRVVLASVRSGEVVDWRPGSPLIRAVALSWSVAERQERADRSALARAWIDADKLPSRAAWGSVLEFLAVMADGRVPLAACRHAFYAVLTAGRDSGLTRVGARLMGALLLRTEVAGSTPADVHWRLASFLRSSGQLGEAVAASEVLFALGTSSAVDRKLLATTRAAALLDLYELRRDARRLEQAGRALRVAWSLGPGEEEIRSVYRRFDALRGG